jgi:hypothetical protein
MPRPLSRAFLAGLYRLCLADEREAVAKPGDSRDQPAGRTLMHFPRRANVVLPHPGVVLDETMFAFKGEHSSNSR